MKTLTFKYLKLFLLAVAMINLTSCEIEIDDFMMMTISVVRTIINPLIFAVVPGQIRFMMPTGTIAIRN